MKNEYEATFINIDASALKRQLAARGATQAVPRTLQTRMIFDSDRLPQGAWLRLRDEGRRTTLTLKQVTDSTTIEGTKEIETEVSDLDATAELLRTIGLNQVRYQENYREEWRLDGVVYDFDTWPDLPEMLEIEGPGEEAVRRATADLGLDFGDARFGSVDEIYRSELGRDILAETTLLFGASSS
ncbi:class IV adenylate cyclase [Streptomyces physcomitrii]|uniref:CYTH domain-containing protein n=1 Tax=Streptomyces physcomitrii TaxID=2724184 RepID=A0ABX1GVD3_9ACTN|nr:CYTH domain-containing protein [Streptomyces physcomitrii]NKI39713.1 CYTH domain-containing protein [Streptomyces physcomitrii]